MNAEMAALVPEATVEWLLGEDNPAIAVLTRRILLQEPDNAETEALWARRNEYGPVTSILDAELNDGSWAPPPRDYKKYEGSLWQVHFLGELWADGGDARVQRAADYAFSRQREDGMWSASNMKEHGAIPCLTANVGRALARLGYATDERVVAALASCVALYRALGVVDCRQACDYHLNRYCHMLTPKELLFLAEVPRELWPDGAEELKDACVRALRSKEVFRCLPQEFAGYQDVAIKVPARALKEHRDGFLAEHQPLHWKEKPGWLRFGFPLSYNSDALEALRALMAVGERRRPEYEPAIELVRSSADPMLRWTLRTSFNGKMLADVETKGQPSKWLTFHALSVLDHFTGMLS